VLVRVSSVAAPNPPLSKEGEGDDVSFIAADQHYAHVGWGDSRTGPTQFWYAHIPLTNFGGSQK
jgi:hypothetical protein